MDEEELIAREDMSVLTSQQRRMGDALKMQDLEDATSQQWGQRHDSVRAASLVADMRHTPTAMTRPHSSRTEDPHFSLYYSLQRA